MKKFEVTIKAIVYKTITVEAEDADQAYSDASELFTLGLDDWPSQYDETVTQIKEVDHHDE